MPIFSHVDLRVRNRERATAFYDAIFSPLGLVKSEGEAWTTYAPPAAEDVAESEWFGFTADPEMRPALTRIALAAETCGQVDAVTAVALEAGAKNIEGPGYDYGPEYYAVFFDDPDGNRLEVCCTGALARAAG